MDDDRLEAPLEDPAAAHEPIEPDSEPEPPPESEPVAPRRSGRLIFAALIIAAAIIVNAWMVARPHTVAFDASSYQAVLLSNGSVYFGKLTGYGGSNPMLTDVYYVQSAIDPQTKQPNNILTRRGKEWHSPDRMYINPSQIVIVEPVGPNSRVAELIKELKLQR